jgi:hypothetical protein
MKQISGNPKRESALRGWQLLCMCVGVFPPSPDFELYLFNFVLASMVGPGDVLNS